MTRGSEIERSPSNWTQEEAISFECAGEAIGHVMAMLTAQIDKHDPNDADGLAALRARRSALFIERDELYKLSPLEIKQAEKRYSAIVRETLEARQSATA